MIEQIDVDSSQSVDKDVEDGKQIQNEINRAGASGKTVPQDRFVVKFSSKQCVYETCLQHYFERTMC